jgi:hypothetical protein
VDKLALSNIFLVVHKVEAEGAVVPILPEGLKGLALVLMIND